MKVELKLLARTILIVAMISWNLGWALEKYANSCEYCLTYLTYPYVWISGWILLLSTVALATSPILYLIGERRELQRIMDRN